MKRFGMVLTFDTEVQAEQARAMLAEAGLITLQPAQFRKLGKRTYRLPERPTIESYEDDHGGPVWYIP